MTSQEDQKESLLSNLIASLEHRYAKESPCCGGQVTRVEPVVAPDEQFEVIEDVAQPRSSSG